MTALELRGLKKSFGRAEIIRGVDLDVKQGERHAIIGPNGAGKSTLFNLVSGRVSPTAGSVHLNGHEITGLPPHQVNRLGLSRSFQITNIFPRMSVFENIRCALLWPMGYRYAFWRLLHRERVLNDAADAVLKDLDMMDRRDLPAGALSYAEQRALEIGITIAGGADVILLDEPSAGMSHSETDGLVAMIREKSAGKTLVMIEHDMGVVFELADRVSVLVYGHIIASGPPAEVRQNPAVQEAYLGAHGTVLP